MLHPLQFITTSAVIAASVLAPVYIYATVKFSKPAARATATAALQTFAIFMLQSVILTIPNLSLFAALKMNWWQKLLMFTLTVLIAKRLGYDNESWGFAKPKRKSAFAFALLIGMIVSIPTFIGLIFQHEPSPINWEYLSFELTMPGLQEECLYRGLILCIWDRALATPFSCAGVKFGIGAVISSLLFTAGHTFMLDQNFHPIFAAWWEWLDLLFFSSIMVWFRYKCGSFWPLVIAHNFGNVTTSVVAGILDSSTRH